MASQTVMTLCSSFTPKLATFSSPTPTLLPRRPAPFSCSFSLPTPCLKATYGGLRVQQTSRDFKCFGYPDETTVPLVWGDVKDVQNNQEVESLGRFAVGEHNKIATKKVQFDGVKYAELQMTDAGVNYRLDIKGSVDNNEKVFKAVVLVRHSTPPKDLKFFAEV